MSTATTELRYLSETEAQGRILRRGDVRWKIVGFCVRRPRYAIYAQNATGQVGNHFVILERLDDGSAKQPAGFRKVVAKQTFPAQGYELELRRVC